MTWGKKWNFHHLTYVIYIKKITCGSAVCHWAACYMLPQKVVGNDRCDLCEHTGYYFIFCKCFWRLSETLAKQNCTSLLRFSGKIHLTIISLYGDELHMEGVLRVKVAQLLCPRLFLKAHLEPRTDISKQQQTNGSSHRGSVVNESY